MKLYKKPVSTSLATHGNAVSGKGGNSEFTAAFAKGFGFGGNNFRSEIVSVKAESLKVSA